MATTLDRKDPRISTFSRRIEEMFAALAKQAQRFRKAPVVSSCSSRPKSRSSTWTTRITTKEVVMSAIQGIRMKAPAHPAGSSRAKSSSRWACR